MSDEELEQKISDKVDAVLERLEKRLCADRPVSESPPPPPLPKKRHALSGWQAAGVVVAVITAVATPVLALTWYTADSMGRLEAMQVEIKELSEDMNVLRREAGANFKETNAEIQRLREAFAAYTRIMLPAFVGATLPSLPQPPPVPPVP